MIGIMDLNAPPLPEDEEDTFEQHFEGYSASEKHTEHVNHAEHVESAVDILRREREERCQRLKRDRPDDRPMNASQPPRNDQMYQEKHHKPSDRNKLPPGDLVDGSRIQELSNSLLKTQGKLAPEKRSGLNLKRRILKGNGRDIG